MKIYIKIIILKIINILRLLVNIYVYILYSIFRKTLLLVLLFENQKHRYGHHMIMNYQTMKITSLQTK